MGAAKSKESSAMGEYDGMCERKYKTSEIVAMSANGYSEVPFIPSLVSAGNEVLIVTFDLKTPIKVSGLTKKLELQFTGASKNTARCIDLNGMSPIEVCNKIRELRGLFNNQFRFVHEFSVKNNAWFGNNNNYYSYMVETTRQTFVVWANVITGMSDKPMKNVPAVIIEDCAGKNTWDVHVLFPNLTVASSRHVTFHFAQTIDTNMGSANEVVIMYDKTTYALKDSITNVVKSKAKQRTPDVIPADTDSDEDAEQSITSEQQNDLRYFAHSSTVDDDGFETEEI